jgi:diketogulonate reductase-like aldo/keto reductase
MEYITLNNGIKMPVLGFGVFQVPDKEECAESVYQAIKTGYRLIDTAASYTNEDAVGVGVKKAIDEGICNREDLFITSKLWVQDMQNYEMAKKAIAVSIEKSRLEYLDLYLLHQAMGDYFAAWRAMEDAYKEGKLKAIGVSNFYPNILTNFCETVTIKPMLNQVELHPYFTQEDALITMKEYHVIPEAWAPLGGGRYNPFEDKMLMAIADKYQKTVAQVMLRWNIQRGVVVIPKSTHLNRITENINVFDFVLNEDEMKQISSLDQCYSGSRAKHFDPDFVRMCITKKIHE